MTLIPVRLQGKVPLPLSATVLIYSNMLLM